MSNAVIVDAVRTPIGRAVKGSLKDVRADDLAAIPLRALLERNPQLDPATIVDVMMGAASGEGEQGYNVARNALILAGYPLSVPGTTVNRFCASSLQTIRMAFHAITAGEGDTYVAAGVEAVSRLGGGSPVPFHPQLDGSPDSLVNVYIPMGLTAENVAEREGISREAQDRWAEISQNRAVEAQASGHFDREIVPVVVPEHTATDEQGQEVVVPAATVTKDDGPRPGTTMEKLSQLRPAFRPDGTVTAGNACPLNDGAAAVLVMAEEKAAELGMTPKARIVASAVASIEPEYMGLGPIPAVRNVLKQAGMTIDDIDVVELNEAFATQAIAVLRELGMAEDAPHVNPNGGAIALGHPLGASGARLVTTAMYQLQRSGGRHALCTMCIGVGQGIALAIERV